MIKVLTSQDLFQNFGVLYFYQIGNLRLGPHINVDKA